LEYFAIVQIEVFATTHLKTVGKWARPRSVSCASEAILLLLRFSRAKFGQGLDMERL
jgi:hypothetical protein